MERWNWTMLTEFILIGIPTTGELRGILFLILLLAYLVIVLGNTLIITLIFVDYRLHSSMYFFLSNLSCSEILTMTCAVPKMLAGFLSERNRISFSEHFTQSYFYFLSGCTEFIPFAVVSSGSYVAIYSPLLYPTIMTSSLFVCVVILSWVGIFFLIFLSTILKAALLYCGPNETDHFFCDSSPLLHLACADVCVIEVKDFLSSLVLLISSLSLTVVSYVYIISTILKILSGQGQHKAFATCASHVTVVSMGIRISIFVYIHPSQESSLHLNKVLFIHSRVITLLLNPFIFTLWNESIKDALKDTLSKCQEFLKRMRSK